MAGIAYGSFAVGDANIDNVMLQTAAVEVGHCALTLTEMTTYNVPKIAAGSKIEINGTLFHFDSTETISGSATAGTNYIYITADGVPTWTATAPTWFDSKQGWYTAAGTSRYIPFKVIYATTPTYKKQSILSFRSYADTKDYSDGSINIVDPLNLTGDATIVGSINNYALFNSSSNPILLRTGLSNVDYTEYITVKRPISVVFILQDTTFTSISLNVGGSYYLIDTGGAASKCIQLNPGYYKLLWHSSTTGGKIYLAIGGVFGSTSTTETNHVVCVNG